MSDKGQKGDWPEYARDFHGETFKAMVVIDTDQGSGRLYRCACGWEGWSSWGHARKHAAKCARAVELPEGFTVADPATKTCTKCGREKARDPLFLERIKRSVEENNEVLEMLARGATGKSDHTEQPQGSGQTER